MLAHELRSPLAVMCNSLELIRHAAPQDQTVDRAVGVMQRQVNYMTRLIENLLDMSRAERATPPLGASVSTSPRSWPTRSRQAGRQSMNAARN